MTQDVPVLERLVYHGRWMKQIARTYGQRTRRMTVDQGAIHKHKLEGTKRV